MSILSWLGITKPTVNTAPAVASVKAFVLTEADKAVAALKQTDIGTAAANAIMAVETKTNADGTKMTGAQKFGAVVADVAPLVVTFAEGGGIPAVIADVQSIVQHLVQSLYNDLFATKGGNIISSLLKLLGVK